MFVFKVELLVLTVLVLLKLEVCSANSAVLKEANNTQVDDPDSAELEYHSDESQEKQKPPRSKTTKISRILTTEKDNFMDIGTYTSTSTSPILEQSTEKTVTDLTKEVTNNDESHSTEPSITKDEIISKTTPSLDDVTNSKHSEDDHALSNETLVTDENEENNNPSTLMTSNEVTIATSTEIHSISKSSTKDYHTSSDSDSTTQLPFTVPTPGFTYNLFPENVLHRPSLEELDNDNNTKGISDSFIENPDIFNSTASIISITKDEIISKTTPTTTTSLDDVTNPKHSEDDHALSNETLVTDKNEEKNNPSTLMTSNEVTIATSTEIHSISKSSTEDYHTSSDCDSTTQLPFTVPTPGFTYNLFPENVLDRPNLEELDNDGNTKGISNSFIENPDIFNSTESIISNNISSTTSIQDVTENTQNIGLSDLNPENVMTTPKPIILTYTNNVSIVKISDENLTDEPNISNLTDNNVTANSTIISTENINEVAVIDNMTSIKAFNTTEILETRKQLDELNDTNTTPESSIIKDIESTSASSTDTNVSSQETNTTDLLHNEHIHWDSDEILNTNNTTELNGTTMIPSDISTELVNSSSSTGEEKSTTQSTDWTVSLIPDKLDKNNTSITKPPIDNFTEDIPLDFTKNIELTTTKLPITGLTDIPMTTTPDNITSIVTGEPVEDYKTDNNISSEIAKNISGSIDENSKEDNTSVPEKDIDLDSSLPVKSIYHTNPMPIGTTNESPNSVVDEQDTSESEINVNRTKNQVHLNQQIDTNESNHNDPINTSFNGTTAIDNSNTSTEDRKQLKNNTLIIISLQDPIDKPENSKNSLQRLFMMMMMYY